eukprot:COSAG02_NODE_14675_length_1249_cov_1.347826_2_plen_97_part_00
MQTDTLFSLDTVSRLHMIAALLAVLALHLPTQVDASQWPSAHGGLQCGNESTYYTDRGMTREDYTILHDVSSARMCCTCFAGMFCWPPISFANLYS